MVTVKLKDEAANGRKAAEPVRLVLRKEGEEGQALGFIQVDHPGETTLADLRKLVGSRWDAVPAGMTFLWNDVPVARKQEGAEMVSDYLPLLSVRLPAEGAEPPDAEEKAEEEAEEQADGQDETREGLQAHSCEAFEVEEKEVERVNRCTGETVKERRVELFIKELALVDALRSITREEAFYITARTDAEFKGLHLEALIIYDNLTQIKAHTHRHWALPRLVRLIEDEGAIGALTAKYERMLAEGELSFRALWYLFKPGVKVVGREGPSHEWLVAMEVAGAEYRRCMWLGNRFVIKGSVTRSSGAGFYQQEHEFEIRDFAKAVPKEDLPVRVLDEGGEEMAALQARGRFFRDVGLGSAYLAYSGNVMTKSWWCGYSQTRANGRCMVDPVSFRRYNPNYPGSRTVDASRLGLTVSDANLFSTWPTLPGFSFAAKKWGELVVEELAAIQFDDAAFRQLVAPPENKALIKALVENNRDSFRDIISGKGGGCIFLLHGPPGVGKTLTAEAIAELLHRPLYSVSVGELGTNTKELEECLQRVLELSEVWNAVLLIDEADIFLERRTESDIQRNAMVGIFLRLLEYHGGVLFLTTNRIRCFDSAFHSRISVALKYNALGADGRTRVWEQLLQSAGLPIASGADAKGLRCDELAHYELNGRQIKNTIRLAQSLAASEGVPLDAGHIERTVEVAKQFQRDIKGMMNV